jgi:hypothetical protein
LLAGLKYSPLLNLSTLTSVGLIEDKLGNSFEGSPAARLARERSLCQALPQQTIGNQRLALRYQTVECNEIGAAAQLRRPSKSVWQRFDIRAKVPDNYQALRNELEACDLAMLSTKFCPV